MNPNYDEWAECQFGEVQAKSAFSAACLRIGDQKAELSASQAMALGHWLITQATLKISLAQAEIERNTIRVRDQR